MDALPKSSMSAAEFFAWCMEQPEGCRYELAGGELVQMGSEPALHAMVKGAVFLQLRKAADAHETPFQIFPDGMAIEIDASTVYEPDAALRYGPNVADADITYSDPLIVVEVLSPSTRHLDAAGKLIDYFRLPSLQHYLILHPGQKRVIHHQRDGADIRTRLLSSGELNLDPPGITLDVAAFFA